jgi:pimeloyl-ACP methyl ester carboxylesterase
MPAIEGSRLLCIPGCGHTSPWEKPVAVNAALADFLAAQPGWNLGAKP